MSECFITFVFGVKLEKALAQTALPQPDPSNEDTTWPCATDAPAALSHPMKAELVKRFGLTFDDFGVFGIGWQHPTMVGYLGWPYPTMVGYLVGKPIVLNSESQVTSLETLSADLAEVKCLYGDKVKMLAQALYPGRSDVQPELKMLSFLV